jgi:hypothetical protein
MSSDRSPAWLLLVISLPTQSATARMRVWRTLKALGCMALRDGAYLLPQAGGREDALLEIAEDCVREGGVAWLMGAQPRGADDAEAWRALFDRSADYAELRKAWKDANRGLSRLGMPEPGSASGLSTRRRSQGVPGLGICRATSGVIGSKVREVAPRYRRRAQPAGPFLIKERTPRVFVCPAFDPGARGHGADAGWDRRSRAPAPA